MAQHPCFVGSLFNQVYTDLVDWGIIEFFAPFSRLDNQHHIT
jgi:hypothetical protein